MNRRTTTCQCLLCGTYVGKQEYCAACRKVVHAQRRDQAFADYPEAAAVATAAGMTLCQRYDTSYRMYSHYQLFDGPKVWNLYPGNLNIWPSGLDVPVHWRLLDVVDAATRLCVDAERALELAAREMGLTDEGD